MRRMILGLASFLVVAGLTVAVVGSPEVYASSASEAVCEGAGLVVGAGGGCVTPAGSTDVNTLVQRSLNIFSAIIGIIAVVMIMISGVKYITSQGDSGQVNSAKNTALYAVIGIVIVSLAQLMVRFVMKRLG